MSELLEYETLDGRLETTPAQYVVYLSKPASDPSGDQTTIHLDAGELLSLDSMRTLGARLGGGMLWLSPVHSDYNVVVNAQCIAALSKPNPADSPDDHTLLYLTTGETLLLEDAMGRVKSLVNEALPATEWISYDRCGGDYEEHAVKRHLVHVSPVHGGKAYLHLEGGCIIQALDPDGELTRDALVIPIPHNTVTARQRASNPEWRPYCPMCRHDERMEETPEGFRCTRCHSEVDYDLSLS